MTQFMVGGLEQPTSTGIFCILSASGLLKIRLGVVWLGTRPVRLRDGLAILVEFTLKVL